MVVHSDELISRSADVVIGGKAEGLVRLLRAGVSVPNFFVLPPDCPPNEARFGL